MKKYVFIMICLLASLGLYAQEPKKFSPEKFEADLQEFITQEAGFDQQEAAKFFPLLREMHTKQRGIYGHMNALGKDKPSDEARCAEAIKERDKMNVELRQVEQTYHKKMMQVVPASKVYDAIRAEGRFHRKMMKGWQNANGRPKDWHHPNGKPKDRRR